MRQRRGKLVRMSDAIAPALTAEEWKGSINTRALQRPYNPTVPHYSINFESGWSGICVRAKHSNASLDRSWTHAIAALALHEQPFGFTREDLDELALAYAALLNDGQDEVATSVHNIRARIAALLPPEE